MQLTGTTTIRKPAPEVYGFWRDLKNHPTFMAHLDEVRATGDRTSHWSAAAPFGKNVGWDAEIVDETPGEKIAWRSSGDAEVPNAGSVRFAPAPDGASTEVHVVLVYDIPSGTVGRAVAKLKPLLQRIERGEIDPTRVVTHILPLDEAERGFEIFKNKQDDCEKVVLKP